MRFDLLIPVGIVVFTQSVASVFVGGLWLWLTFSFGFFSLLVWQNVFCQKRSSTLFLSALFVFSFFLMRAQLPGESGRDLFLKDSADEKGIISLQGEIQRVERPKAGEVRIVFLVKEDGQQRTKLLLSAPDLPWVKSGSLRVGDRISLYVKPRFITHSRDFLPDPFSYQGYLFRRGISGVGTVRAVLDLHREVAEENNRERFLKQIQRDFGNKDALSVLLAGTLGEMNLLSTSLNDLFRETGTSHLLVVSGFHVGILFAALYKLSRFLFGRFEILLLHLPIEIPCALFAFAGACAYTVLVGGVPTTIRSIFALGVFAIGQMLGRKSNAMQTLFLAMLVVLLFWPGSFFELGFQLTFAALLGLLLVGTKHPRRAGLSFWKKIVAAFISCLGAWTLTTAVLLVRLQTFSPLSPIINLVSIPLFSIGCICFGAVSLPWYYLGFPFGTMVMKLNLWCIEMFLFALNFCNEALRGTPFAYVKLDETPAYLWAVGLLMSFYFLAFFPRIKNDGSRQAKKNSTDDQKHLSTKDYELVEVYSR